MYLGNGSAVSNGRLEGLGKMVFSVSARGYESWRCCYIYGRERNEKLVALLSVRVILKSQLRNCYLFWDVLLFTDW